MKTRYLIWAFLVAAVLAACQHKARYLKEAETHFEQGLEQRAAKQSEEAAESFSQALPFFPAGKVRAQRCKSASKKTDLNCTVSPGR